MGLATRSSGTKFFLTASFIAAAIFLFWRAGNVFWRCLADVGAAEKSGGGSTPRSLSSSNRLEECAQQVLELEETRKLKHSLLLKLSQSPLGVAPAIMLVIAMLAVGLVATTQGARLPDEEAPPPATVPARLREFWNNLNLPQLSKPESDTEAPPTQETSTTSTNGGKWAEWLGRLPIPGQGTPPLELLEGDNLRYVVGKGWTGRGDKVEKGKNPIQVTFFGKLTFTVYLPGTVDDVLRDEGVLGNFKKSMKTVKVDHTGPKPRVIWGRDESPAFELYKTFDTPTTRYDVYLPESAVEALNEKARLTRVADGDLTLLLLRVLEVVHTTYGTFLGSRPQSGRAS
ncbi:hypothetical protein CSUI_008208 [Cystoisospora suis]|uniref:Transmembrane protein n=1 Tax=Cystoisospora suis TaxID=483139 RepID=A0A2C6KMX5_9APIC|nr:hypothetical protein CSUI_008208 [Cystoisospora suis]